jgi:hypothetical protein
VPLPTHYLASWTIHVAVSYAHALGVAVFEDSGCIPTVDCEGWAGHESLQVAEQLRGVGATAVEVYV